MWPALLHRATKVIREKFADCRIVLDPDGAAHTCLAIFHAEQKDVVPDGEGGVSLNSVGPVVDVRLADIPVMPATRSIVAIELQRPDGTYAVATRYRITDTQDDGYGGMKLLLMKGG
jgi:hypothetical protein